MNTGRAAGIFKNIDNTAATDDEKIEAINEVVAMETHNGITKTDVLRALNWAMRYLFFIECKNAAMDPNIKKRPIIKKSDLPTLVDNLGYLNSVYCPRCGKHLFSYYDKQVQPNRPDGYKFKIRHKCNFCSECGLRLDLDEWKDPNATGDDINNLYTGLKSKRDKIKFDD